MRWACLALLAAALAAQTVVDAAGRSVALPEAPERIVLIRGRDWYEVALLLGDAAATRVVAIGPDLATADHDAWQVFTRADPRLAALPRLGSIYQDAVSVEAVLAARPDLVLADVFMRERGYRCLTRLEAAGLPLLYLDASHDPWTGPQRSLRLLGRALGCTARAETIAAVADAELARVRTCLAGCTERPSVYLECGNRGPDAQGASYGRGRGGTTSAWAAVLEGLPCRNVTADAVAGMAPARPEWVLAEDPDHLVITGASWLETHGAMHLGWLAESAQARALLAGFTTRPGWPGLRAVRTRRVHALFHGFVMHPSAFAGIQQLARWLHPARCRDLDPAASLTAFHQRFLPGLPTGTWMASLSEEQP